MTLNGVVFFLSYRGGASGTDVVLLQPGPLTTTGTAGDERWELRRGGSGVQV